MSDMTRRQMGTAAAAFALLGGLLAEHETAAAQQPANDLGGSRVFRFADLKERPSSNGGWSRAVTEGKLVTGESVEVHQTMLPPGKMPHSPHRHSNSEFILLREGKVAYLTDGKREVIGPGDIIYTASNQPHGMVNVGDVPAIYFVVSVGVKDKATPVDLKPAG